MELTKDQLKIFAKGFQAQHDDMFSDLRDNFNKIQETMLIHNFSPFIELDFEDFGKESCIYFLEQYCIQARLIRDINGLSNCSKNKA